MSAFESEFGFQEEYEFEQEGGYESEWDGEAYEAEAEGEAFVDELLDGASAPGELDDQEVDALAAQLLEITDEAELDEFIGKLISRAARGVSRFARSSTGRALGGVLKGVARKALPIVGGAIGSFVAPGVGTALGSKLGSMASRLFEVDLETMGEQEAEFEVARRYVRLATSATNQAARAPRSASPQVVAQQAVVNAARRHAPGLARAAGASPFKGSPQRGSSHYRGRRQSGTWSRRGNVIVVHGA
jgi:uncharacterized protein (DUF697 family)